MLAIAIVCMKTDCFLTALRKVRVVQGAFLLCNLIFFTLLLVVLLLQDVFIILEDGKIDCLFRLILLVGVRHIEYLLLHNLNT